MKMCKTNLLILLLISCLILVLGGHSVALAEAAASDDGAVSQTEATSDKAAATEEELAQLLAPIALYPDTLLMQMFMASTYPLEVVEAARFVKKNPKLKDDALDKALKEKDWDESVKSICHFSTVLASMDKNLDATKKLGDFFLEDQKAVMDMVQTLRTKAKEQGELKTTKEQKVIVKENTIIIEPADPQVVYVPSYSSTVVYGSWWYPSYPPYVWYPPPPAYGFVAGVAIGVWASHHWCHANWHRGSVDIDIDRNININRPDRRPGNRQPRENGGRQNWKHNPKHRKGVSYRNRDVRKRYGQSGRNTRQRDVARGYGSKGLDRKTRDSIKKQGLKSGNGRFGQGSNRKATRPTGNQNRRDRSTNSMNRSRQTRDTNRSSMNRSRQTRNTNRSSVNRSRQTRSRSSFSRSGSARQVNRSSNRGRASRSFSSRGGGRRGGGRRR
jgi:hypothetical protein